MAGRKWSKSKAATGGVAHEPVAAPASWSELLERAVREPGVISDAYSAFWNYSMGNQILAWWQCAGRGIQIGPIATFKGWLAKGRCVRKGEKAIILCKPAQVKARAKAGTETPADDAGAADTGGGMRTIFLYRRDWFVLAQTDGDDVERPVVPGWDRTRALTALGITEVPFTMINGNCQGYAQPSEKKLAINPVAKRPDKTLFHELGHCLLHDSSEPDNAKLPRNLKETEAESVALICCDALGLAGAAESRGYIQHWYGAGEAIPDANARRIFSAAQRILEAGRPAKTTEGE